MLRCRGAAVVLCDSILPFPNTYMNGAWCACSGALHCRAAHGASVDIIWALFVCPCGVCGPIPWLTVASWWQRQRAVLDLMKMLAALGLGLGWDLHGVGAGRRTGERGTGVLNGGGPRWSNFLSRGSAGPVGPHNLPRAGPALSPLGLAPPGRLTKAPQESPVGPLTGSPCLERPPNPLPVAPSPVPPAQTVPIATVHSPPSHQVQVPVQAKSVQQGRFHPRSHAIILQSLLTFPTQTCRPRPTCPPAPTTFVVLHHPPSSTPIPKRESPVALSLSLSARNRKRAGTEHTIVVFLIPYPPFRFPSSLLACAQAALSPPLPDTPSPPGPLTTKKAKPVLVLTRSSLLPPKSAHQVQLRPQPRPLARLSTLGFITTSPRLASPHLLSLACCPTLTSTWIL